MPSRIATMRFMARRSDFGCTPIVSSWPRQGLSPTRCQSTASHCGSRPGTKFRAPLERCARSPSPHLFGKRDQTLRDRSVRDTGEISESQLRLDADEWNRALEPALEKLGEKLGLPREENLVAVLDKMLVYSPGQFFATHQDSERTDDMVGSLSVQLPCASSGGEIVVHHQGETLTFRGARRAPKDLSLLAFYADCHHEVKPITSGHRVVLTWHLLHSQVQKPRPQVQRQTSTVEALTDRVRAYFSTPIVPRYGTGAAERPDRLIYLLDHQYTEKSLSWSRLKNGDRLRRRPCDDLPR